MSQGKKISAQPALIGQNIYLRPMMPEDIERQHLWRTLSEVQTLSCHTMLLRTSTEEAEAYRKRTVSDRMQAFAVCLKEDGTLVASVSFFDLNSLNRSAELGLIVSPDERKKGYGAEAIRILTDYLFDYRGLYKVHAQTGAFNTATVALLESLGFHLDARLRSHYYCSGEFHDGLIYSLLLSDRDR